MDHHTKKKIEDKLQSEDGLAIRCQKNTKNPKEGSMRLEKEEMPDGDADILVLKRFGTGWARESRTRCQNVAGVFFSRKASEAIVLLSATPHAGSRFVRLDPWRFTIADNDTSLTREDFVLFLRSKGAFANGVLTNVIPTEAMRMAGQSLSFDYSDPGVIGLTSRTPEILRLCENMFSLGQSVAVVAPVFTLFATVISNFEFVQGLKLDFMEAMASWSKVEAHLEDKENSQLRCDLLDLAEDFFFKPGWRKHFASKDFQSTLTRLLARMDRAVQQEILKNVKLDSRSSQKDEWLMNLLPRTLAQAREDSGLAEVLDVASFVCPDNIPLSILGDKHRVDQLCDLSLLQKKKGDDNYSIDPRIQKRTRKDRSPCAAFRALHETLDLCGETDSPRKQTVAVAVLSHVEWLRNAAAVNIWGTLSHEEERQYASLLRKGGHVYRKILADFESSRLLYNDALTLYRIMYATKNHLTTAKTLYYLGVVNDSLRDYHEARKHYREALSIYRALNGKKDNRSEIAETLCGLGLVNESLCEYETAKEHFRDALVMYRALYGKSANELDIATVLRNLGNVYSKYEPLSEDESAERHYREALKMYGALKGKRDNRTAIAGTLYSLGNVYKSQEAYDQAKSCFEQALVMYRAVYGEETNHSEIARTQYNLGIVCESREDYAQAEKYFRDALAMYQAVSGKEGVRPSTAKVMRSLGRLYESQGDYEQAERHFAKALALYRILHGHNKQHPEVEESLRDLKRNQLNVCSSYRSDLKLNGS